MRALFVEGRILCMFLFPTLFITFCSFVYLRLSRPYKDKTIKLRVCLFGFSTRLYRTGPKTDVLHNVLPHTRPSGETMTSVSAGHIILTPFQPVGCGQPQRGRIRDLITRSHALYRLSYPPPPPNMVEKL